MSASVGAMPTTPTPGSLGAWWLALRPKTLIIAVVVVGVGTAVASHLDSVRWPQAGAALAGALLLQVASNFANDLFDFRKGADTDERIGPTRAVAAGLLSQRAITAGLVVVLLAAVAVGGWLAWTTSWVILGIGVAGIVSAVAYTGGPYPLGYHGLGDVFVFVFFGLAAVAGTCFVQTGTWEPLALILGVPMGCFAAAVLTVNNIRDLPTDTEAGKRTIPVRLGRTGALRYFAALLSVPYFVVVWLILEEQLPASSAVALVTFPLAWRVYVVVRTHTDGPTLNAALGKTAGLLALFGALLSVGTLIGA